MTEAESVTLGLRHTGSTRSTRSLSTMLRKFNVSPRRHACHLPALDPGIPSGCVVLGSYLDLEHYAG